MTSTYSDIRIFIGVIGPPAVGKSTLAAALSAHLGEAPIIRPRDAIRAAVAHEPQLHTLFAPINELGWVSDGALGLAVREALARVPASARTVVLENLPGDAFQVADLHIAASRHGGRLIVLHLDARDETLIARGSQRRVCQACESDSNTDPHEPALAQTNDSRHCARCGSALTVRADDEHAVLHGRTIRHRKYALGVLQMIEALNISLITIDATADVSHVERQAIAALKANAGNARYGG